MGDLGLSWAILAKEELRKDLEEKAKRLEHSTNEVGTVDFPNPRPAGLPSQEELMVRMLSEKDNKTQEQSRMEEDLDDEIQEQSRMIEELRYQVLEQEELISAAKEELEYSEGNRMQDYPSLDGFSQVKANELLRNQSQLTVQSRCSSMDSNPAAEARALVFTLPQVHTVAAPALASAPPKRPPSPSSLQLPPTRQAQLPSPVQNPSSGGL